MKSILRSLTILYIVYLLSVTTTGQVQAITPIRLSSADEKLSIFIATSYLAPASWSVPSRALTMDATQQESNNSFLMYGYTWQPSAAQLIRLQQGSQLRLSFADARAKTYTIYNLIAMDSRRSDYAQLAEEPHTLLIFSSTSVVDADRLVIVAKEQPETFVSSL